MKLRFACFSFVDALWSPVHIQMKTKRLVESLKFNQLNTCYTLAECVHTDCLKVRHEKETYTCTARWRELNNK